MATFINDEHISHLSGYSNYTENITLTGSVSRSGNTVTLSNLVVTLRVAVAYTSYGNTQEYYITDSSSSTTKLSTTGVFNIDFNDGPNHTQTQSMNNMNITVWASATSKTLYMRAAYNEDNVVPFTITFPAGYTAPNTPTISVVSTSPTSVDVTYGTTSFGNPSSGTVTLYGGTSSSPTTVINSKNTTGNTTFSYTGLDPNTTYYFRARATNGQLNSSYSREVSAIPLRDLGLYGSVNGEATKITNLYGSVTTTANKFVITYIANNPNLNTTMFMNKYSSINGDMLIAPKRLLIQGSGTHVVRLQFTDNSTKFLFSYTYPYTNQGLEWGFYSTPNSGDVTYSSTPISILSAKKINKLYGSVNGEAKLIFQRI